MKTKFFTMPGKYDKKTLPVHWGNSNFRYWQRVEQKLPFLGSMQLNVASAMFNY